MKHSLGSLFDQATLWSQGIVSTGTRIKHLSSTIIGSNKFKWFHGRLKIYHSKISCNCMYRWWSLIQWHLIYFIGSKDVCKLHDRWKYITTQYFVETPPRALLVSVLCASFDPCDIFYWGYYWITFVHLYLLLSIH